MRSLPLLYTSTLLLFNARIDLVSSGFGRYFCCRKSFSGCRKDGSHGRARLVK